VLLVLVFLVVWCVYFVSLLCCQSLYFYWFDVFTLYHCCVVSPCIFIGLMCLLCITVVLLVLVFLLVWCVYFVSLLCCQSLYFYWFDVFTLYHCCVVSPCIFIGLMCLLCITVVLLVLVFLLVWCVYFVSQLCCQSLYF
jgi:hypothetical protein